jgi:arylsulfatase A-like enzyme
MSHPRIAEWSRQWTAGIDDQESVRKEADSILMIGSSKTAEQEGKLLSRGEPLMRLSILLVAILVSFASPAWAGAADPQKPNVIFILIDDMGWKDLGCYGSTFYETPHIDKLAAQGMKFTNGYAACPVCSPTRASILTGKYPARLHLTDWIPGAGDRPTHKLLQPKFQQFLPLEEVTIAKALKPQGYISASIGKWHLGGEAYFPEKHGFDVNIGGTHAGTAPGGYFKFETPTLKLRDGEYLTDRLTEEAEKFIEKNQDKPFFLYMPHYGVHTPYQAKPDVIAKYKAKIKPGQDQNNPIYAAMVESVDDSVGRIVKKLDELKIAGRTVLVFFSDNGGLSFTGSKTTPATSNAPLREGKSYLYEGGIRVPLIVRWPGQIKPGIVCEVPVSSVDFFPTIMEITGSKPDPKQIVDGMSLLPLLKQTGDLKRQAIYWHYPHYNSNGNKPGGAIRAGDFKVIEFYEDGKLELYNLKHDIGEKNDLAAKMPDKLKELHQMLKDWRKSVDAQMPTPNPDYKPVQVK